jgi:hypothetical protein
MTSVNMAEGRALHSMLCLCVIYIIVSSSARLLGTECTGYGLYGSCKRTTSSQQRTLEPGMHTAAGMHNTFQSCVAIPQR